MVSINNRASDEMPFLPDEEKDTYESSRRNSRTSRYARLLPYSGALNIILSLLLVVVGISSRRDPSKAYIPNEIYSPAQEAVEYETWTFSGGLRNDTSQYVGSGSKVDAAWDALYNDVLISQIDATSASKLPNPTTPFTNSTTSKYIIELDVFHQLHCLNMLRKLTYPSIYPLDLTSSSEEALDNVFHTEHCYEQLRQSLMCSSDISTIFWEWSEKQERMLGNVRTTHTCKNFGRIREWAVENKAERDLDFYKWVEGAPIHQED